MLLQVRFGTQAMGGVRGDTDDTWYMETQRLVGGHSRCQRCSDYQIPLLTGGSQQPYRRTWELGKEARPPRPVSHQCLKENVWSMWQSWLTWDCTETELFIFFFQKRLSTNGEGFFLLGQSAPHFLDPTSRQPYTCRGKALALPLRNETSRQMEDRALQTPQQDALGWAIKLFLVGAETRLTRERGFMHSPRPELDPWILQGMGENPDISYNLYIRAHEWAHA